MNDQRGAKSQRSLKITVGVFSACVGAALVVAGFRYSQLNWIVDGPGWIVSRFMSVDFHEGEGALGFLLAVLLAWMVNTLAVFFVVYSGWRIVDSRRSPGTPISN